ncbi:interferon-inducible GTPase 5-like [Lepisosteus oculatus]|uniref:interferon-inducible GTPase 5-like n=1 Tax=Lepisosteus oculatus TaxID=7918 RepID=UPI00371BC231
MTETSKKKKKLKNATEALDKSQLDAKEVIADLVSNTTNIAVAGERGRAKSSFINVVRGLRDDEEGAAPGGQEEPAAEPTKYPNPKYPDVRIWDLPAPPAPDFDPEEYLEDMRLGRYCSFIIAASETIDHSYYTLSAAVMATNKPLYFIILASPGESPECLQERKRRSVEGFKTRGMEAPRLFLVSSWALRRLEFVDLLQALQTDLSEMKMNKLLISLPAFAAPVLRMKSKAFRNDIMREAHTSGGMPAVPFLGVGSKPDLRGLETLLTRIRESFGLDRASLERLAKQVDQPVEQLRAALSSEISSEVSRSLVKKLLAQVKSQDSAAARVLDSSPAGGKKVNKRFSAKYRMLKSAMDELEKDAEAVLEKAWGGKD